MTNKATSYLKRYPLSLFCIALIWFLCIWFDTPETPLSKVSFIDKWTHLVMYGGTCSVIWVEYWRSHQQPQRTKLFLLAWLAPVVMGGIIELVQEYCTTNRSGEWLDLLADAIGVTLGAIVGWAVKSRFKK